MVLLSYHSTRNSDRKNPDSEMQKKLEYRMKIYSYAVALLLDYTKPDCYEKAFDEYNDYLKGVSNYK